MHISAHIRYTHRRTRDILEKSTHAIALQRAPALVPVFGPSCAITRAAAVRPHVINAYSLRARALPVHTRPRLWASQLYTSLSDQDHPPSPRRRAVHELGTSWYLRLGGGTEATSMSKIETELFYKNLWTVTPALDLDLSLSRLSECHEN